MNWRNITGWIRKRWLLLAVMVLGAYLALANLGSACFWDDEAHVGIMARNLIKTGRMTGWDGRNLFGYRNGRALDAQLRPINPPLDILTCAASFKALGERTATGRLPFVMVGLVAIVLAVLVAGQYDPSGRTGLFTAAVLALSPWFLLYIRQCRYFSLSMATSLLAFLAYQRLVKTNQLAYVIVLVAAAVLGFFANPLLGGAFLFAMTCYHVAFNFRCGRKGLLQLVAAGLGFVVLTAPYAIIHRIWIRPDHLPSREAWLPHRLTLLWWNLRDLNYTTPMPWVIAAAVVAVAVYGWRKGKAEAVVWRLGLLVVSFVVFLSCFSPQPTTVADTAEVRYLVPIMPFLAILTGWLLAWISGRSKAAAVVLLGVLVCTNLLTLTARNLKWRWLLPGYISEISAPFTTSTGEVVEFLKKNAGADDKIFAVPDYFNYPIAFYVGDKIRVCCVLKKDTHISSETLGRLNAPLSVERNSPDWLLAFGKSSMSRNAMDFFSRVHLENGVEVRNEYREFARLRVNWEQSQRPELHWHTFGPPREVTEADQVIVYRRYPLKAGESR